MSFFRNKPAFVTAVVVVFAIILAILSHFGDGAVSRAAGTLISPVEKAFAWAVRPVARFGDNITDADDLRVENEELKAKINELERENRSVEDYINENKRLKEMLSLIDEMTGKEVITASVVSADSDGFSETIVINRGAKDGISVGDAVVSTLGVVGRVKETDAHWSRVTTLISTSHSLGVRVSRTGDIAVCEGDSSLLKDNLIKLDYLPGETQVIEGDIIETSGVGGVYPPGLIVGKVSSLKKDNSGRLDYAVIEPTADFLKLYEVTVITDWSRESESPDYVEESFNDDIPSVSEVYETHSEISREDIENAEG